MRKLLILALLFACSEKYEIDEICGRTMTISDALPVQFWPADCETYNEKEVCGLHPSCFCQPFNCDDEIKLQFQDNTGLEITLSIFDSEGTLLHGLPIDEVSSGVYYVAFTPSELSPDLCNKRIQLIIQGASTNILNDQSGDITGWSNTGTGDRPWLVPSYTLESNILRSDAITPEIESGSNIRIDVTISSGQSGKHLYLTLSQSAGAATQIIDFGSLLSSGVNSETVTADDDYDQVELYAESDNGVQLVITEVEITLVEGVGDVNLTNPTFTGSMAPWTNEEGPDTPTGPEWQYTSDYVTLIFPGGGPISDWLQQALPVSIPIGSTISIDVNVGGSGGGRTLELFMWDGATTESIESKSSISNGIQTFTGTLTSITATHIRFIGYTSGAAEIRILDVSEITTGTETPYTIPNNSFVTNEDWVNVNNDQYPWILPNNGTVIVFPGSANSLRVFFEGPNTSKVLSKEVAMNSGDRLDYNIVLVTQLVSLDALQDSRVQAVVELRNNGTVIHSFDFDIITTGGATAGGQELEGSISLESDIDEVVVYGENIGGEEGVQLSVSNMVFDTSETVVKSDCIDIKDSHPCTNLITYSHHRNFDGIVYINQSPDLEFTIRVPSVFFHERFQEEQEIIEQPSSIIKTAESMKSQKRFDTDYLPYYMHRKLKKIFAHRFITIGDQEWVREEPYEIEEGNKRHPKKMAKVYLTDKNSIVRTVL